MRRSLLGLAALAALAGMSAAAQAADINTIHAACTALGLNPSEAPFQYCVQTLRESAPAEPYAGTPAAATVRGGEYKAEDACRAIGLDPATARFSYCVGNLNQTLFDQQNVLAR